MDKCFSLGCEVPELLAFISLQYNKDPELLEDVCSEFAVFKWLWGLCLRYVISECFGSLCPRV